MPNSNELQLDKFAEYLVKRSFCKSGKEKFYLFWVKRFFREFEEWEADSWDMLLQRYVNVLRDDSNVEDWQVDQAEKGCSSIF